MLQIYKGKEEDVFDRNHLLPFVSRAVSRSLRRPAVRGIPGCTCRIAG